MAGSYDRRSVILFSRVSLTGTVSYNIHPSHAVVGVESDHGCDVWLYTRVAYPRSILHVLDGCDERLSIHLWYKTHQAIIQVQHASSFNPIISEVYRWHKCAIECSKRASGLDMNVTKSYDALRSPCSTIAWAFYETHLKYSTVVWPFSMKRSSYGSVHLQWGFGNRWSRVQNLTQSWHSIMLFSVTALSTSWVLIETIFRLAHDLLTYLWIRLPTQS